MTLNQQATITANALRNLAKRFDSERPFLGTAATLREHAAELEKAAQQQPIRREAHSHGSSLSTDDGSSFTRGMPGHPDNDMGM